MVDCTRQVRTARALKGALTWTLILALALAGCAPAVVQPPAPPPLPRQAPATYLLPASVADWYRQARQSGAPVLRIDPAQSLIVVTVRRGGPLARFGHDHVVASHAIGGLMAPGLGRADFGFRLDQLTVDESPLRAEAKLDTQPSPEAIAGTRSNMLGRVLEAERFPEVALRVDGNADQSPAAVQLSVTLHGVTRTLPAQVQLSRDAGTLTASGALTLKQSDFGIVPMSIMNGAMTVADAMELRYTIVAVPDAGR